MTNVLVGGKPREEVLSAHKKKLELEELVHGAPETEQKIDSSTFPPTITGPTVRSFTNHGDYVSINGVEHRGNYYLVQLATTPIGISRKKAPTAQDYDKWVVRNKEISLKPAGLPENFSNRTCLVLSAPFYMDIFRDIQDIHNSPRTPQQILADINSWKPTMQSLLETYPLLCMTKITYNQGIGIDLIEHNFGLPRLENESRKAVSGISGGISTPIAFDFYKHVIGLERDSFESLSLWLTQKPHYIERRSDPTNTALSVATMGTTKNGFTLDGTTSLSQPLHALGARIWRIMPEDR